MSLNFKFDFSDLWKNIAKSTIWDVEETLKSVFIDIKLFSPIKTWKYASKHRYKWIKIEWNKVIWEIENNWEYSERVEEWFRKTAVNWNLKNLWQLYHSKWANVYAKAIEKNKNNYLKRLKW